MARPFRFIHAADLHLDTPCEGVVQPAAGARAGEVADAAAITTALRDASLQAWDALVRFTLDADAAFLLLAGDIYDGAERSPRAQLRFHAGLVEVAAAGCQVFVVHGNHDPMHGARGWSAIHDWPAGVTVFDPGAVSCVPVQVDGQQVALIQGVSYEQRDTTQNLARLFHRAEGPGLQVGLLHANVGAQSGHQPYAPCALGDLEAADLDYWALGHIHKRQTLRDGGPWAVYPGNTQGRSVKPSETGAKGALLVEVDGSVQDMRFHELDCVRFVNDTVDVSEAGEVVELQEALAGKLDDLQAANNGRGLVVRLTLSGTPSIAGDLRRDAHGLEDVLGYLREQYQGREPFVWVESLRDGLKTPLDREALRLREDLVGELARRAEGMGDEPAARADFVVRAAGLLDQPKIRRALAATEPDDPAGVLDEALELALDLLVTGDEA